MRNNHKICSLLLMFAFSLGLSSLAHGELVPEKPPGVDRILPNQTYGESHPLRTFDVFLPAKPAGSTPSPIIFMVHGGGWDTGDKVVRGVYYNKAARWVPRDFVFVSINYRLINTANPITPLDQTHDVALALAEVQRRAPEWNANPNKVILMGHSAGAHLISLFASTPMSAWGTLPLKPWLGTVSLDGAALNVVPIMRDTRHPDYFDTAFGTSELLWEAASPIYALEGPTKPWHGVCSPLRPEWFPDSCDQSDKYAIEAQRLGSPHATWHEQSELSHEEINSQLGLDGPYTRRVEVFMRGLDSEISKRLPLLFGSGGQL